MSRRRHVAPAAVLAAGMQALALLAGTVPLAAGPLPLRGRVLDERGAGLAGASVELLPVVSYYEDGLSRLDGASGPAAAAMAWTDGDGGYEIAAPGAGLWVVRAYAGGRVAMESAPRAVFEPMDLPPVALRPDVGAVVHVAGEDGAPLAGALLRAGTGTPALWQSPAGPWRPGPRFSRTDGSGRSRLARAPGEVLRVLAFAPGYLENGREEVGEGREEVLLVRGTPRTIQVLDGDGTPLPGVLARLGDGFWPVGVTDAEGRLPVTAAAGARLPLHLFTTDGRHGAEVLAAGAGEEPGPVRFRLPRPPAVEGRVTDAASGKPIAGALVWPESDPRRHTLCGPGGTYSLPLEKNEDPALRAAAAGYLPAQSTAVPARSSRGAFTRDLALERSRLMRGSVVDERGLPIAGAAVSSRRIAEEDGEEGEDPPPTTADGKGRFELRSLPAGRHDLVVAASGFAAAVLPQVAVPRAGGEVDVGVVTLARGVSLEGVVVDEAGEPVAAAEVAAVPAGPAGDLLSVAARTGADGRFAAADLPAGVRLEVSVRREGFAPAVLPGVEVPAEEPLAVVLRRASRLSGRVVDREGRPVPGAVVSLTESRGRVSVAGAPTFVERRVRSLPADAEGRFEIADAVPGTVQLQAFAPGFQPGEPAEIQVPPGRDIAGIEIALDPGAVLAGQVRGPDGQPVAGARVRVLGSGPRVESDLLVAFTDGKGSFRLPGVAPGPREVEAAREGYGAAVRRLEVMEGETLVDLILAPAWRVSGRTVDSAGLPVAAARCALGPGAEAAGAASRADGSFTFPAVTEGSYTLRCEKPGHAPGSPPPLLVAGADVEGLEIRLEAAAAVAGRLEGAEPADLAGAEVAASGPGGLLRQGRADAAGRYRIGDLGPGRWEVTARLARGERRASGAVHVEPGDRELHLDLDFGRGLVLSGRATLDGQPLAGATLRLRGEGAALSGSATTGHDGGFAVAGLDPGRYRLELSSLQPLLLESWEVELPGDRVLPLALAAVRLRGRVLDAGAEPVAGALVTLQRLPGGGASLPPLAVAAVADARGRFALERVVAGRYRLLASGPGLAPASRELEVRAGAAPPTIDLVLLPAEPESRAAR